MPIYEFFCRACDQTFEVLVSLGGEHRVSCIHCGRKNIQKLHSTFGIGGGSRLTHTSSSSCSSCTATSCDTCR